MIELLCFVLAIAGRPIEHPGRNLQPSPGRPTREAATENLSARLLNHLMNMDHATGPRMPRMKKLVLRDPVGVPSSCCTMTSGRTGHWTKMHQSLVKFSESEAPNHTPSLADFTTTTPELKFSVHTGSSCSRKLSGSNPRSPSAASSPSWAKTLYAPAVPVMRNFNTTGLIATTLMLVARLRRLSLKLYSLVTRLAGSGGICVELIKK
jgi:hypothetical protein